MRRMRRLALIATTLTMTLGPVAGCGDDSDAGGGDDESTGGAPDDTTTGDDDDDDDDMADGSSSGGAAEMGNDESTGEEEVEVTVSGVVEDLVPPGMPIPDAAISVFGDDTITATANAGGLYEIGPFPAGSDQVIVVAPSDDYFGSVIHVDIRDEPEQDDEQLAQISRATIDMQIMGLEEMMPAEADLTQAVIVVRLLTKDVLADGGVEVTMSPAPEDGTYYAPDESFAPVLNLAELVNGILPVVVYFNVDPADPGTYTFTYDHPSATCDSVFPDVPTLGEHITLIDVVCE